MCYLDTNSIIEVIDQRIYRRQMPNYPFEITFLPDESLKTISKTFHCETMTHARKISQFAEIFIDTCAEGKAGRSNTALISKQAIIP